MQNRTSVHFQQLSPRRRLHYLQTAGGSQVQRLSQSAANLKDGIKKKLLKKKKKIRQVSRSA